MHFQRVNFNFMCEYLQARLCIIFMPGAREGEKRTLGPLGLKLKTVMSRHVGSGDRRRFLWKSSPHS